jgi:hypothetical protein
MTMAAVVRKNGFGEVKKHGHWRAVSFEEFVADETRRDRTDHGGESHEIHNEQDGKWFRSPIDAELLGEEHD